MVNSQVSLCLVLLGIEFLVELISTLKILSYSLVVSTVDVKAFAVTCLSCGEGTPSSPAVFYNRPTSVTYTCVYIFILLGACWAL